ncbi:hypothetical protein IC617_14075 [Neiella sp. HB171785]|uniref:Uncharacterized protein n=1 Tax=Neiella litorisoli TaxID=2771431 RepID=A0A8J6QRT2_9GAMM|nr:hypothetical protein [Neiella litorisoli]MBD1390561.1 hypothetical protein [Neiella litorisoli]
MSRFSLPLWLVALTSLGCSSTSTVSDDKEAAAPPAIAETAVIVEAESTEQSRFYQQAKLSREQLKLKITEQQQRLATLLQRYTDQHPEVVSASRKLESLQSQLESNYSSATQQASSQTSRQVSQTNPIQPWRPKILDSDQHYLPNFSYAGYRWGEQQPRLTGATIVDVTEFGVVVNDEQDDSVAMLAALEHAHEVNGPVIVQLPQGRVDLSRVLAIQRSQILLRGAGSSAETGTELFFSKPLLSVAAEDQQQWKIRNLVADNQVATFSRLSPVSWKGGFIWTRPGLKPFSTALPAEALAGKQGQHELEVDDPSLFFPGQTLIVSWCNQGCQRASFDKHLMAATQTKLGRAYDRRANLVNQFVTVEAINGHRLRVKEPLLHHVKPEWRVKLRNAELLEQVGFEQFRVTFPKRPYAGHHREPGFNAFFLNQVKHGWLRDIATVHADNGIIVEKSANLSLSDIRVLGRGGHYTMSISTSNYVLATNFQFTAPALHSPAVGWNAELNVYSGGQVNNAKFNLHRGLNQQNLFDDIDAGVSSTQDLFTEAGGRESGPIAAGYTTYWNVRAQGRVNLPITVRAPGIRLIGLDFPKPLETKSPFIGYAEGLNQKAIEPASLYRYQLNKRLAN